MTVPDPNVGPVSPLARFDHEVTQAHKLVIWQHTADQCITVHEELTATWERMRAAWADIAPMLGEIIPPADATEDQTPELTEHDEGGEGDA